jgi:two-component system, OmpR family, phosphate regulon sensor histidine kinase PhoR
LIRQVRTRLFFASSALLVLIDAIAILALRDSFVGISAAGLAFATIAIALATAAVLAYVVGHMLRRDLRELVTTARAKPRPNAADDVDGRPDVDDWVHGMAADAHHHRAELQRERALLSAVLDAMTDGVIVLDRTNRIVTMNEAARRLLGLVATPIGEVLIDVNRSPSLIELVREPGHATAEIQLRPELRAVARISDPLDSGVRVLYVEDVTAMRRLETIRRDFVANVSHELRTPVAIIRANSETLINGAAADPSIAPKLLDGVHRNAERLARMLADLLDLARLDAGQFRFDRVAVAVGAAFDSARAAVDEIAAQREVAVHLEVDRELVVRADARALDHALVNLVENAVKYGNRGGNVWVRARAEAGRVRIVVADDGPGIAPKHRERVFERFYRVDSGRARDAGGTGLGLAIVKHLVESMDGRVGVDANTPTGTQFWLELPQLGEAVAA